MAIRQTTDCSRRIGEPISIDLLYTRILEINLNNIIQYILTYRSEWLFNLNFTNSRGGGTWEGDLGGGTWEHPRSGLQPRFFCAL
jgi:hypothetical protein